MLSALTVALRCVAVQTALAGAGPPPPASPPHTSSQSSLLIYSIQVGVPASVLVPAAGKCLHRAEAGGYKRGGKGYWRQWWEPSPGLLAHDSFSHSSSWSVSHPHICLSPSPIPSFLPPPFLSAVPVSVSRTFAFSRGDSLAGSPGNGHGFGKGPLHVPGSFQLPVHGAPSPLHPACRTAPGEKHPGHPTPGSPSLVGARAADG